MHALPQLTAALLHCFQMLCCSACRRAFCSPDLPLDPRLIPALRGRLSSRRIVFLQCLPPIVGLQCWASSLGSSTAACGLMHSISIKGKRE